ncbi:MAG: primosomal protein N' [Nitrospirae bacterium]|nr:primosomal protein N' [Nitrospirota bacterium]
MPPPHALIEVLLPKPLPQPFHYLVPEEWRARAVPGVRAVVPFGREVLTGIIVDTGAPLPAAAHGRLRSVLQVVDDAPLLAAGLLELLRQLAEEYLIPWGELLHSAVPASLLPAGDRRYHLAQPIPLQPGRSRLARQILLLLERHPKGLSHATLAKHCAPAQATGHTRHGQAAGGTRLNGLLQRLITAKQISVTYSIKPLDAENMPYYNLLHSTYTQISDTNKHEISHFSNNIQSGIVDRVSDAITTQKHIVFVNFSAGSSINGQCAQPAYQAAAAASLRTGRSLLLLAPEISRVEALAGWLQELATCPVVPLHSGLTPSVLARHWLALRTAAPPVIVVGTRLALFAPLPSLGLIIIDEEADPLYKQEERPRLHARDLAIRRGRQAAIPVVLSARVPSVDSAAQCQTGQYHRLALQDGSNVDPLVPNVDPLVMNGPPLTGTGRVAVVDLRTEPLGDGLLSKPLIETITERMARGEQSLLFVNRRGYAHSLICRDCGELVRCAVCRIGLAYYESTASDAAHLRCRGCGARQPPPTICPHCRGHQLGPLGTGTQRVERAVRQRWPDARILRVDRDAPIRLSRHDPHHHDNDMPDAAAWADLHIGTQRCLHAPSPPRLSLVAVLDAELDLSHPDFRAEERQLQLLVRLRDLLQPALDSSTLLVQSRQPDRPVLQALTTGRLEPFYAGEIAQRRSLGYPPFRRLAALRVGGRHAAQATIDQLTAAIRVELTALQGEQVELWGPIPATPASTTRRTGAATWEWLLKAETAAGLRRSLQAVTRLPQAAGLLDAHAMEIEVDPL